MNQFTEKQVVQFGNYLLSQERKKRFEATTRQNKKDNLNIVGTRSRLAGVHDADIQNFMSDIASNPDIQYTRSSECILKK